MNSLHYKTLAIILLSLLPLGLSAQEDEYWGTWSDVQVTKPLGKFYTSLRVEYRSKDNMQATDLWFIRPTIGYKFTSWLKFDIGYDYLQKPSTLQHRMLFSLTGTLKSGPLSVSVRERYIPYYSVASDSWGNILRSQFKAQYAIPESIFKPYLAVEMFTWKRWEKTRHYVGTIIQASQAVSFDLFYLYYTFDGKPSEHVIGTGLHMSLPPY